eukprot:scaffold67627_cov82-Phaeocystis_antarctica.AAC.2
MAGGYWQSQKERRAACEPLSGAEKRVRTKEETTDTRAKEVWERESNDFIPERRRRRRGRRRRCRQPLGRKASPSAAREGAAHEAGRVGLQQYALSNAHVVCCRLQPYMMVAWAPTTTGASATPPECV